MAQLLPDGLNDPAVQEPIASDPVEYGDSWEFHMGGDCDCGANGSFVTDKRGVFDGVTGTGVSTEATNLLSADLAHNYQASPFTYGGTVDDSDFYSGKALTRSDPATATQYPRPSVDQPADPSTEYSVSWKFKALDWAKIDTIRLSIQWFDSVAGSLGISNGPVISNPTEITVLSLTATSPALTAEARIYATIDANAPVEWRMGEMMFCEGSDPTFVPSTNIVGDLEWEFDVTADTWSPAANQALLDHYTVNAGYSITLLAGGSIWAQNGNGASPRGEGSVVLGFTDGSRHTFGAQWDVSAGTLDWFADGASFGTQNSTLTGAGVPGDNDLYVGMTEVGGSAFAGVIHSLTIRDGFGGPITSRYDASPAYDAYAAGLTEWTDPYTGRLWSMDGGVTFLANEVDYGAFPHLGVRGHKVMRTEGVQTLEQWIRMALATDRFRWEVYDNQYGTEFKKMIEDSIPEDEAETETIRVIREAILLDPRIASVTSIKVQDGRSQGNPSAFVAEVRVVTFTGELRLLQLDMSTIRTADAYFNS